MHNTNQDRGPVATDHVSGTSCMSPMRRDPSAGELRKNPTQTTPAHPGPHEDGTGDCIVGGPIKSPRPSDKECLARARGVGLFDIAGLATTEYHGGHHGVQELTVLFIHNCGYQSFSNTDSPEDILICFGEIQQIHQMPPDLASPLSDNIHTTHIDSHIDPSPPSMLVRDTIGSLTPAP
jgi:hypothetical protein